METKLTEADVTQILAAFKPWINQDAGLDRADYGCAPGQGGSREDLRNYHDECRRIAKDGTRARRALKLALTFQPNAEAMESALTRFSGRLTWNKGALHYCTGQYWPTEYRIAAAVVLEDYNETCRPKYKPVAGFDPVDIDDIKSAAKVRGSHWFDKDTLRFFAGRVLPTLYKGPGGIFFVSSEQYRGTNGYSQPRKYTVRRFDPVEADVDTVGEFNVLSRSQAVRLARQSAETSPA